jgi:hypothetical protein
MGDLVRKMTSWLFGGGKSLMVLATVVAVASIGGTAFAGKGGDGNDNGPKAAHSDGKGGKGSKGAWKHKGDKSDHANNWWKWKKHHDGGEEADTPEYGVATVSVARGGQPPTVWATYSTLLGSPVGDTTGGVFRFTCSTANAPCTVSVGAAVLSEDTGSAQVYPRVLIYRQNYDTGGPEVYCEYGDGSTGSAPLALGKQAPSETPAYLPVPLNIGGSADCEGPVATAGDVPVITVAAGYYDVHATFAFSS